MVKDSAGRIEEVLKTFVEHGAPEEIYLLVQDHKKPIYIAAG